MKMLKNKLHKIAIRNGWYRQLTKGLPLNLCKTVFGVFFLEGNYEPQTIKELCSYYYEAGINDGQSWESRKICQ